MRTILIITFYLILSTAYGQNGDYFGSIVIPKNEYFIKIASTQSYWYIKTSNKELLLGENDNQNKGKFMFIPAGDGYYYIKYQLEGNYINITNGNISKGVILQIIDPKRNDAQKFKVVSKGNNHFKFVTVNNLVIECIKGSSNDMRLRIWEDNGGGDQTFEILQADNMKKLD